MESLTTTISPDVRVCGKTVQLSPIDQIAPRDYNVVYSFFPLGPDANKVRIFQELEVALSRTAEQLPQVVSVVRRRQNESGELELEYDANRGAHLSLKDYTLSSTSHLWQHGTFDDLQQEHFPMKKLERHLLLNIDQNLKLDQFDSLPGLCVQANFIQGGLILSNCLHHTICDGTGNAIYHETLAREMCIAAGRPLPMAAKFSAALSERTTIVQPSEGARLEEHPHWKLVESDEDFLDPIAYNSEPVPVQYGIYFISEENIRRLRSRLNSQNNTNFSAMDAACAFLWLHVLRARSPDAEIHPESKLSITVDARTRMTDCHVPGSYWGNFSEPNAVACLPTKFFGADSSGNVVSDDASLPAFRKKSLHAAADWSTKLPHAAQKIKQAISAVDNVAVRRLVGLLAQMPRATSLTWNVNRWPGPDMLVVCANKIPLTTVQYGSLGYSQAARFTVGNTEDRPDGRCLLLPSKRSDGRGMEIALQYDLATLERLREDREFAEYMEWRN